MDPIEPVPADHPHDCGVVLLSRVVQRADRNVELVGDGLRPQLGVTGSFEGLSTFLWVMA